MQHLFGQKRKSKPKRAMEYILSKIMHRAKTTANTSSQPKKNEDNKGTDEVTSVESTSHVDVNSTEEYKNAGYSCDENESSCQQEKGGTLNKFIERGIKTDENKAFTQRQPSIDDTIDGTIDETGIDLLDESTDNQALVKGFQAHHLSNLHDATLESLINGLNNLRDQNCTVRSDINTNTDDEEFVECQSYGDTTDNTRLSSRSNSLENIPVDIEKGEVEKALDVTLDANNSFNDAADVDLNLFKENNPDLSFEQVHLDGLDESKEVSKKVRPSIDPLLEASQIQQLEKLENTQIINTTIEVADNGNLTEEYSKPQNVIDTIIDDAQVHITQTLIKDQITIDFEENLDDLIAPSYIQKTSSLKQLESPAPSFNETIDINASQHNATVDVDLVKSSVNSLVIDKTQNLNITVDVADDMTFDTTPDLGKTQTTDEKINDTINIDNKTFETNINHHLEDSKTYETFVASSDTDRECLETDNPFDKGNKTFDQAENLFSNECAEQQINSLKMPELDLNDRRLSIRSDIFKSGHRASESSIDQLHEDNAFKRPVLPIRMERKSFPNEDNVFTDAEFHPSKEFNFSPSDLDYLLTKGNSNLEDDAIRDSVLLRFDPLLSKPVLQVQSLKIVEEESSFNASSFNNGLLNTSSASQNIKEEPKSLNSSFELDCISPKQGENDKMSLGNMIIENDLKEQFASGENKMSEQNHQEQDFKMTDLQKKMKNDAVKIDDIEKKLKEAEMREDALLKRITEKDKTINKMSGVVEAYEKAIAELIAEKETIVQQCEKKYTTLLANSEVNEKHLDSLEKTFSDLHAKYERTKQMSQDLKENEERLLSEQRKSSDLLKKQEQRYEKMKNHALVQLEIANNKLSDLSKAHQEEVRRLKAQLKKEEISKLSTTEQLLQKTKENEELVKICDELLSGNAGNS